MLFLYFMRKVLVPLSVAASCAALVFISYTLPQGQERHTQGETKKLRELEELLDKAAQDTSGKVWNEQDK